MRGAGLRKLLVVIVISALAWFTSGYAEEHASSVEQKTEATKPAEDKPKQEEGHGISVFWMVFIGAILFVLSSATALNSLGGKPPPRSGDGTSRRPRKPKDDKDPKDRFRL